MTETLVISVGGSVLCPDNFDADYAVTLLKTLKKYSKNHRYILVCGGGSTARKYMSSLKGKLDQKALDKVGIVATHLHAQCLYELARSLKIKAMLGNEPKKYSENFVILGGTTPGHSTDFVAVQAAVSNKASFIINISNVDMIYTKDPKAKDAKPIWNMSWKRFEDMVGKKFISGMHVPFDPQAIALAKKHKLFGLFIGKDPIVLVDHLKDKAVLWGTIVT